ncbi:MAG: carboxypeptidase-like regulatory domain-containing protein [Gemmatimonadaceae bacterium]|nr:carboxypeptidase-like regulatory domain-containing protein [Gemmatimonadaceae bacterium]
MFSTTAQSWPRAARVAAVALAVASTDAQQRPQRDVLRGRVTQDDGAPVRGARVSVTRGPDRKLYTSQTDSAGSWRIVVDSGTGDYLVHVSAAGRRAVRRRLNEAGSSGEFRADFVLMREDAPQELATVRVSAERRRPKRGDAAVDRLAEPVGSAAQLVGGMRAALSPASEGDLTQLAATAPGFGVSDGGLTFQGLGPGQNNVTMNGVAFVGGAIPRGMSTQLRVSGTQWEPSRGWASGAQLAITIDPGDIYTDLSARTTIVPAVTQSTDAVGRFSGAQQRQQLLSAAGSGMLRGERWAWSGGAQLERLESPREPFDADATSPRVWGGVSLDSLTRALAIARGLGVVPAGAPPAATIGRDRGVFLLRLDHDWYDAVNRRPSTRTLNITAYLSAEQARGGAGRALWFADPARRQRSDAASLTLEHSAFLGRSGYFLVETRSVLAARRRGADAEGRLPAASILVGATASDGLSDGSGRIGFGGGTHESRASTVTWETMSDLTFFPGLSAHRLKGSVALRLDHARERTSLVAPGTFEYPSLEAWSRNAPSRFARTTGEVDRRLPALNWFGSLGDSWRVSERLSVLGGLRVEGTAIPTAELLPAGALLAGPSAGGASVNGSVVVSPRLGFSWTPRRRVTGASSRLGPVGSFVTPQFGALRGGIGRFRNLLGPSDVIATFADSDLGRLPRELVCLGDRVPSPSWDAYLSGGMSAPLSCRDGTASAFSSSLREARVLGASFSAPQSWRSNLSWTSRIRSIAYTVEAIGSLNERQPSLIDANFADTRVFSAADDARAIYVAPTAIDPRSGRVAVADSRTVGALGRVLELRSDGRSRAAQVNLLLQPNFRERRSPLLWTLGYSWRSATVRQRGFESGTLGDPTRWQWLRGSFDARHQFTLQAGISGRGITASLFTRIESGQPFTPRVDSDVNGDGFVNDLVDLSAIVRAEGDGARRAVDVLRTEAQPHVRTCIARLLRAAGVGQQCERPWTTGSNAQVAFDLSRWRTRPGTSVVLNIENLVAGIDAIAHRGAPRGWDGSGEPDPALLVVRAFDPSARRFLYDVNPGFGSTRPLATGFRSTARVSVELSIPLGASVPSQQIDRFLRPGRAGDRQPRLPAADLARRYARALPDPYSAIAVLSDSLFLTTSQLRALASASAELTTRLQPRWARLGAFLAEQPDAYKKGELIKHMQAEIDAAWEEGRLHVQRTLAELLLPEQLRLLPYPAGLLWRSAVPIRGLGRTYVY